MANLRTNVDAGYRKLKLGEIEKSGTLDSMVADLAKLPLEFSPGDAFNYSVSTDILGYLVGKISGVPFETFNILQDPEVRQGLKELSNWPTYPQLYVDGQLVGGADIVTDLHATGELQKLLAAS